MSSIWLILISQTKKKKSNSHIKIIGSLKIKKDELLCKFSGHTKIRHQSHSAFWKSCLFWNYLQNYYWSKVRSSNSHHKSTRFSTLFWGREKIQPWVLEVEFFFWSVLFLANQQQVTPEASGTQWGEDDPSLSPSARSRTSPWVSQEFWKPGSSTQLSFPKYKILSLTNLLHENVARRKHHEQTTSFYSDALSFSNEERILRISRGIFIIGSSGGPLCQQPFPPRIFDSALVHFPVTAVTSFGIFCPSLQLGYSALQWRGKG